MSGLCAVTAAGLLLLAPDTGFHLAWTHSVEKIEWREDWRIDAGQLILEQASVAGSGAGMDPSPEARREGDRWVWRPERKLERLVLALSGYTTDWKLCSESTGCRPLRQMASGDTITLASCD
ncbi:hypothetical protein A6A04_18595 [Paramagnetospirillum marisnigri]|uniref:DUF1850 domain-containing protein n=1 Tax=Paramagnetospirillum marisnigri TaxID=1285242 RepID=A0A178MPH7_9PROT|nr:DUF1850 domain-containing protein [Paramagnetospirillum marisnigri]OAN49854.1 hypothetical protein A6A04_18595 [Paramagnetospirillum marisnigri]